MKEAIKFLRKKGLLAEDKTQFVIRKSDGTEMCELSELLTEFKAIHADGGTASLDEIHKEAERIYGDMDISADQKLIAKGAFIAGARRFTRSQDTPTDEEIDHKLLLKKYIDHVVDCEGSDYLGMLNHPISDVKFNQGEINCLLNLGRS